jgi:hypothetical protein
MIMATVTRPMVMPPIGAGITMVALTLQCITPGKTTGLVIRWLSIMHRLRTSAVLATSAVFTVEAFTVEAFTVVVLVGGTGAEYGIPYAFRRYQQGSEKKRLLLNIEKQVLGEVRARGENR